MPTIAPLALFQPGELRITPGALEVLNGDADLTATLLARHITGNWIDDCPEDREANRQAIQNGSRIFTGYNLPNDGGRIWIITESDRSATTLLLPDEY